MPMFKAAQFRIHVRGNSRWPGRRALEGWVSDSCRVQWRRRGLLRLALGLIALTALLPPPAIAEKRTATEDELKAAYLYNFARYVEWPSQAFDAPGDPLVLGVIADDEFSRIVERFVAGKTVNGRSVRVDRLARLADARRVHLLFISDALAGANAARQVSEVLKGAAVFTVSDQQGFARGGGMATFIRVDSKIRFEINDQEARDAGLKVSSRLLRLAQLVE